MKTHAECLNNLQKALSMELAAVQQYLLHAHLLEDWGLDQLGAKMREEMQEELGHAGTFINRIMFHKSDPEVAAIKKPQRAKSLKEMFEADLADERDAIKFYTKAAQSAADASDIGTRTIFEEILLDEEGHMAWLQLQLDLLKRMGEPAYIARHMTVTGGTG